MSTYSFTISGDFTVGNDIQPTNLHTEILDEGFGPNLDGVVVSGDDVDITFDSALSGSEQTTLNNVIAAHDGSLPIPEAAGEGGFTKPILTLTFHHDDLEEGDWLKIGENSGNKISHAVPFNSKIVGYAATYEEVDDDDLDIWLYINGTKWGTIFTFQESGSWGSQYADNLDIAVNAGDKLRLRAARNGNDDGDVESAVVNLFLELV